LGALGVFVGLALDHHRWQRRLKSPGERHAQEQVNAIAKQPDKGFARVDEAVVRVAFRLFCDNQRRPRSDGRDGLG